jgi:quercetin dioxygenase-like cupin family protein
MNCNGCVACAEQPYGVEVHTADGVFVKQMVIPKAGTIVPQHSHVYDHITMLAKGSVLVHAGDMDTAEMRAAPCGILIRAGVKHSFTSMEDGAVLYCIHRERDGGVAILEEHQIVEFV